MGSAANWSGGSSRAHYSIYTPCDLGAGSYDAYDTGYDAGVYDRDSPYSSYDSAGHGAANGCGCVAPPPPVDPCACDPYPAPVNYPARPSRHQTWVQPIEIRIDFDLSWIWSSSTGHHAKRSDRDKYCGCD